MSTTVFDYLNNFGDKLILVIKQGDENAILSESKLSRVLYVLWLFIVLAPLGLGSVFVNWAQSFWTISGYTVDVYRALFKRLTSEFNLRN